MSNFLESLESRTFLSAVPAVVTLHTDEASVKGALTTIKKDGIAALKTIKADLKAADLQKTDSGQVKAVTSDFAKFQVTVGKAIASATAKVNADTTKLLSAEAQLAKKPGNATLTAKVSADNTALSSDAAAKLTALTTAFQGTTLIADLTTIIGDGGTVGTDASATLTKLSGDGMTLNADATLAYSTDVTAILAL